MAMDLPLSCTDSFVFLLACLRGACLRVCVCVCVRYTDFGLLGF